MTKITVVIDKSTNKIVPFEYLDNGEIRIISIKPIDEDLLIVKTVDSCRIDWDTNTILDLPQRKHIENHPFYVDFYTN